MFVFIPDGHIRCCIWSVMLLNNDKNKLLSLLYSMLALAHQTGRLVVLMCSHTLLCISTITVHIFAHKCLCYRSKHEMTFLNVKWSHTHTNTHTISLFLYPILFTDNRWHNANTKAIALYTVPLKGTRCMDDLENKKKFNWIEMRSILY